MMADEILANSFFFNVDHYYQLIDEKVQVQCIDEKSYLGRIYTIDPVSQSVVLIDETSSRVHILIHDDILRIKIVEQFQENLEQLDPFLVRSDSTGTTDSSSSNKRLEQLRQFLRSKRIPFDEILDPNGDVQVTIQHGIVTIRSPYTLQTISGTNEIVLSRFKQLLKDIFQV